MGYRPDNLGANAQPITMNKIDIAQQEQGYTLEDNKRYLEERVEDIKTVKDIGVTSVKQGIAMGKAKYHGIKRWSAKSAIEDKTEMLKKRLSQLSGIDVEQIDDVKLNELSSQYEDDSSVQAWLSLIDNNKKFYDVSQNKIDNIMGYYNTLEENQLRMINNLNDGVLKGTMPFISDVVTGMTDFTNVAKQLGIAAVVSMAAPGIAAGGTALGIGKVGQMFAKKGIEYGLNAIDNWFTMEQEHELTNPNSDPLTTKEKTYGMVLGTVVDMGIDAGGYALSKVFSKSHTFAREVDTSTKKQAMPNDGIPLENTSAKNVAKKVYDAEHGVGSANEDLFRLEVSDNPDKVYNVVLDPNNPHSDIYDNMFNNKINIENEQHMKYADGNDGNNIYYYIDNDTREVKKFDIGKDRINPTEPMYVNENMDLSTSNLTYVDGLELEAETIKYKIDNNIPLDERIYPTYQIDQKVDVSEKVKLYPVDDFNNIYIETSDYNEALSALMNSSDNGTYAKVEDGKYTTILFKDGDNVVSVSQDINYINRPLKDKKNILSNNYLVRKLKDNLHHRVEIIDKKGNKVNIYGMQKQDYINRIKRLNKLNNIANVVNILAESLSGKKVKSENGVYTLKGDVGRTIVDIVDPIISEINHKANGIVSNNIKEFKRLMKDPITGKVFFKDLNDLFANTDKCALAELFVHGKTDRTHIFNKAFDNEELVIKQLQTWIDGLVDDNTFIRAYKTKMNLEIDMSNPEIRERYKYILKENADGTLTYNNNPDGFFAGMNKDEIEYRILEMMANPERIDLGYEKDFPDRKIFYELFEDFTADKQNVVAIKRVFEKNKVDIGILEDFGIIRENEAGELVCSIEDFTKGLSKMLNEMLNPETEYSVDEIKKAISLFNKADGLPRKFNVEKDGYEAFLLYDFILNNKNNSKMNVRQFHQSISPIVENLDEFLKTEINKILPDIDEKNTNLQIDKIDKGNVDKIISVLESWKKKFSKENGANSYLGTKKYEDELSKVKELIEMVNLDGENIHNVSELDNLKEVKYSGDITFENIPEKIAPIIDSTNDTVQNNIILQDKIDTIKNTIGRKRKIADIISTDEFKANLDDIATSLREQGISEDIIKKLYSDNHKDIKDGIKEITDIIYNNNKKRNMFLDNLEELEGLKTPEDIQEYIKKTRNRKKITSMLDTMIELGADKETVDNIKDFINYHGKEYDYKLDKDKIIKSIDEVLNSTNNFKSKLDVKKYGEKRNAYKQLYKRYTQLRDLVKDNTPENSIKFLKSKDLKEIYDDIIKYGKIVGEDIEVIEQYRDIVETLQKALNDIQDSRQNSPLKNLNKKFTNGYRALTSSERQKFGRLESVIDKDRWLQDKSWFKMVKSEHDTNISKKTDLEVPRVMSILFQNFDDVENIPDGTASKFILPEKLAFLEKLYQDNKNRFRGIEIFNEDGELISTQQLSFDQFAVVYAKFLEELSDTTQANKKQSIEALLPFFQSEEDMISFFTQRQENYGAGYVKDNRAIVRNYNENNAQVFSEIDVLGMDRQTFANKLNINNPDVKKALKKNAIIATDVVDGKTIKIEKDVNTTTKQILQTMSSYLKRTKQRDSFHDGIRGVVDKSYHVILDGITDFLYPVLLNCTGLIEQMFNPIFAFRRTSWVDAKGNMFGYKSSNRFTGNMKMYTIGTAKGLASGVVGMGNIFVNGGFGLINALSTLDRYLFFQNAINRVYGKNLDLRLHGSGLGTTTKILSSIHGEKDERVLSAIMDMYMIKQNLKGKRDFVNPKQLPFKGNKMNYIKTAFSEAFDAFKEQAMNAQEVADMSRGILSASRARDLMEEFLTKSYVDLPESIKGTLRNFGIDINNYNKFADTLRNIRLDKTKNSLEGVFLMDLLNQIPDIKATDGGFDTGISKILKSQDIDMLSAIQNVSNYFFDNAFVLDKKLKYSAKTDGLANKLAFALRHTTIGIGLEDISDIFHDKTASGLYESKLQRFSRLDMDKKKIATNMLINGATSLPFFLTSAIVLSNGGHILDDMVRKPERVKEDIAEAATNWSILKRRVIEDKNLARGVFRSLSYLLWNVGVKSVGETIPITSVLNGGNFLSSINPYIADAYLMFQKAINKPGDVDKDAVNEILSGLSYDVRYDEIDHMNEGRILPFANFLLSTSIVRTLGKIPASWYKAWTLKDDKSNENMRREKFIHKHRTNEWQREAALKWDDVYAKNNISMKVNIVDKNNKNDRYKDVPDDTLVPLPRWEDLNEEGKLAAGEYLFDILNTVQEESLSSNYSANVNKIYAINEYGKKNNIIDEETYKKNQEKVYKDMKLDETISQLSLQYQIAFQEVDNNRSKLNYIEKQELHLKMLQDVNNGLPANKLLMKYTDENYNPNNKSDYSKPKKEYNSIDDIPLQYQIYYYEMKNRGHNISEKGVIELAKTNKKIPKIEDLENMPKEDIKEIPSIDENKLENDIKNINIDEPNLDIDTPKYNTNIDNQNSININEEHLNKNKNIKGTDIGTDNRDMAEKLSKAFSVKIDGSDINFKKLPNDLKNKINNSILIEDDIIKDRITKELSNTPILNEEYKEPNHTLPKNIREVVKGNNIQKENISDKDKSMKNIKDVLSNKMKNKNAGVISIDDYYKIVDKDKLPKQLKLAIKEFEKHPITGDTNVKEYFKKAGFGSLSADNNWCAAFLSSIYSDAGYKLKEKTVAAQAFAKNGKEVSMNKAKIGDTLVFRNRDKNGKRTWTGHVNMIAYIDDDIIIAIGGNQSETNSKERDGKNTINFKVYDKKGLSEKTKNGDLSVISVSNIKQAEKSISPNPKDTRVK